VVDRLAENPTLLLFVVAGCGFLLARIRIAGFSLGIAAVLFAGVAIGAAEPSLKIAEPVWTLGLSILVYTIGLASGPSFVAAMRRRGIAANAMVLAAVVLASLVAAACVWIIGVSAPTAAGIFAGGLTNTPALASALDSLKNLVPASHFDVVAAQPVVGYALAYPLGVLLPLLACHLVLRDRRVSSAKLVARTAEVERDGLPALAELAHAHRKPVTFGRLVRDGHPVPATPNLHPREGDLLTVVGEYTAVQAVISDVGFESDEHAELDRHDVDFRRVTVSDHSVAGRRLGDLRLGERFGAAATRVRRGDIDLVADPSMTLELGDQIRIVASRPRMAEVAAFFGDSLRALGEVDALTFSLGMALGLLLGSFSIAFPGGNHFALGVAGGPLVAGLVLGALQRTGPLVWQMPHTANLTLRQLGTVLFLAGIGTVAGSTVSHTIAEPSSLKIVAAGAFVTATPLLVVVLVGRRLLKLSPATLAGVIAGAHTQPAVLAHASETTDDDPDVSVGYATVYPLAMFAKIIIAQVLIALLY
jgi:putative transport protein